MGSVRGERTTIAPPRTARRTTDQRVWPSKTHSSGRSGAVSLPTRKGAAVDRSTAQLSALSAKDAAVMRGASRTAAAGTQRPPTPLLRANRRGARHRAPAPPAHAGSSTTAPRASSESSSPARCIREGTREAAVAVAVAARRTLPGAAGERAGSGGGLLGGGEAAGANGAARRAANGGAAPLRGAGGGEAGGAGTAVPGSGAGGADAAAGGAGARKKAAHVIL